MSVLGTDLSPRGHPLHEIAGYVASESNHAKDRELHKEWERIYVKIAAILESHTDE